MTNTDNDTAGITVTPDLRPDTTEAGGTATFTVVLNTQPTANVTIALSSSDTTEGTVAAASLTFTTANWNMPQTVTVTGVDEPWTTATSPTPSSPPRRPAPTRTTTGSNPADVAVTNTDNDAAGITVSPDLRPDHDRSRRHATFTVVLNTQPTANVTIALSSSNTAEGTVSGAA